MTLRFSPFISTASVAASLLLTPCAAQAVSFPGFDHAVPIAPGKLELGGGAAGGDSLMSIFGVGRLGLAEYTDLAFRAGFIDGISAGAGDGQAGFEVEAGPRYQFLCAEDTGVIDGAVVGDLSLTKTENLLALGIDPLFVASHHFGVEGQRQLYVSLGLGVAVTFLDADGMSSDLQSGFVGAFSSGVDIVEHLRLSLEARLRDELVRYGLGVTWLF